MPIATLELNIKHVLFFLRLPLKMWNHRETTTIVGQHLKKGTINTFENHNNWALYLALMDLDLEILTYELALFPLNLNPKPGSLK